MPVSRTLKCRRHEASPLPPGSGRDRILDFHQNLARSRELDAVAEQVHEHLPEPGHVPGHVLWNRIVHLVSQFEAFLGSPGGQQVQGVLNAGTHLEWLVFQLQLARLDLREVQDVVDDGEQGIAAGINGLHVAMLLVGQRGLQQQPGHGDNAVHGRADLVAHVGQELRFGAGGRLSGDAGGQQLSVGLRQVVFQVFGPQRGAQPGAQLRRFKRLGQVIRRPEFEGTQLVGSGVPGRQHDDRNQFGRRRFLELPQHLEPVDARQPEIEQDQVEGLLPDHRQRLGSIPGVGKLQVIAVQQTRQQLRQARIVFHQQDLRHR